LVISWGQVPSRALLTLLFLFNLFFFSWLDRWLNERARPLLRESLVERERERNIFLIRNLLRGVLGWNS